MNNMKRLLVIFLTISLMMTLLCGCFLSGSEPDDNYRVYYEIFVHSFADGNGDGIGDFKGAADKISYVKELGATGIWLMPIMPSDTYHKYDVNDYKAIDPEYGTMEDFEKFLKVCHDNGIRVIIDMVLNHTSDTNPWFTEAAEYLRGLPDGAEPDLNVCKYVDYYNFSKTQINGNYYPLEGTDYYYEGVFWEEMPDLNLACEPLREEIYDIFDFWIDKGVDGFRMDAVAHYNEEDQDFNIRTISELYNYCQSKNSDFYMVEEIWGSKMLIADYYRSGVLSNFNFDLAGSEGKIIKAARGTLKAEGLAKAMISYEEDFMEENPLYIDAPFVTNHDMGRVSNALMSDEAAIKFAGGLNLIMRGSPFIYYGEEIGMKSKGTKDENKRLAMNWGDDKYMCLDPEDADDGIVQTFASVSGQDEDESSILNYYKNAIKVRRSNPAIARGRTEILAYYNDGNVAVIKRAWEDKVNIIVINTGEDYVADFSDIDGAGYGITLDELKVCGQMTVDIADEVSYENLQLTIPAKGIVVMK